MAVCDDLQTSWFVSRLWLSVAAAAAATGSNRVWLCAPVAIPQTPANVYAESFGSVRAHGWNPLVFGRETF